MNVEINVSGQDLQLSTYVPRLVSDTKNFIRFFFNLPSDWDGLTKTARFIKGEYASDRPLDSENSCYMPSKLNPGVFKITLYGTGNGKTAHTGSVSMLLIKKSFNEGVEDYPAVLTPEGISLMSEEGADVITDG